MKISGNCSKIWKTRSLNNAIQEFSLAYMAYIVIMHEIWAVNHVPQIWWAFFGGAFIFFFFHLRFLYFVGVLNQTIISVALVGNKNNSLHMARDICPWTWPPVCSEKRKLWAFEIMITSKDKWRLFCLLYSSNIFRKTQSFETWRISLEYSPV